MRFALYPSGAERGPDATAQMDCPRTKFYSLMQVIGDGSRKTKLRTEREITDMKIKMNLKAGADVAVTQNHNQTVASGMKIKSNIKAGEFPPVPQPQALTINHNQTV